MLAGAQYDRDCTCSPVRGRVLIIADSRTLSCISTEIVTRDGGSGYVKYPAYTGLTTVKSVMSLSSKTIEMMCSELK